MDERTRPHGQMPSNGTPPARRATGESLEQALRILRRNRELLEGKVSASAEGEEAVGVGHTVSSDPSSGVTRGDFNND